MATFDKLIQEIGARYHLGPKGSSLVQETLDLIARQPGGIGGFLDRFKAAGFALEVASWVGRIDAVPLSGQEVEEALGSDVISEIADKAGVSQRFARTILGFAIPKIIGQLVQGGAIPSAIPAAASIPLSSSYAEEIALPGAEQIPPSSMGGSGGAPGLGRLLIPGACLLITLGVLGYAISSGRSGTQAAVQSAPITAQSAPGASPPAPSPSARLAVGKPVASPPSPSIPASLALSNVNGLIVYSGTVGDDATRTAIIDSLKTVFGADKITGDLAVDQHAGQAGWTKDLKTALDNFKTPGSQAVFEGNAVSVGGTIPDADRDGITSSVKSVLGPQFAVATLAGSGATKTAAASSALKSGFSGKNPGAPNQPALHLPAIYFAPNSAGVPSGSEALLRQAAGLMKQLPAGTVVQISGYTDSAGNPAANMKLSQRRADAVRQLLVDAGANPAMLSAKGYGSSESLANNGTTEGRSNGRMKSRRRDDRRVEFRIAQQ
jgi:OmpA-OmpF porin, OOP family